jgi:hypothetical protein
MRRTNDEDKQQVRGRSKFTRLGILALLFFGFSTLGACSCDKKQDIPEKSDARLQSLTSSLPADTQSAIPIVNIEETRKALQSVGKQTGDIVPLAKTLKDQLKEKLGVNIYELKGWQKVGVPTDGGFVISVIDERPVFVSYVSDQDKFEKHLLETVKVNLGAGGDATSKSIDGRDVNVVGDSESEKVAWAFEKNKVVASFPPLPSGFSGGKVPKKSLPSAAEVVAEALSVKEGDSLKSHKGFKRFRDALGDDFALSGFLNNRSYLTDWRLERMKKRGGNQSYKFARQFENLVNGIGMGVAADSGEVETKLWGGLDPEYASAASKLTSSEFKSPWKDIVSSDLLTGLRLTLNWSQLWPLMKNNMSDSYWQAVQGTFTKMKQQTGVEVEKELIKQMSGQVGIFLHELKLSSLAAGIFQALSSTKLMLGIQFQSEEKLLAMLNKLVSASKSNTTLEKLSAGGKTYDDIRVVKSNNVLQVQPARFYQKGNLAVIATSAFEQAEIGRLLSGKSDITKLSEASNRKLGKSFVTKKSQSGLYINVAAAEELVMSRIPPFQSVTNFFDRAREMLLDVNTTEKGVFVSLRFNLTGGDEE